MISENGHKPINPEAGYPNEIPAGDELLVSYESMSADWDEESRANHWAAITAWRESEL